MITYSIAALHRESNRLKDIERQRSKTRWSSFEYVTVYEGSVFSVLFFQKNSNVGFTPYNSIVIFTSDSMVHNEKESYQDYSLTNPPNLIFDRLVSFWRITQKRSAPRRASMIQAYSHPVQYIDSFDY